MNILAIGAHPDDIELGCGGLLIKAVRNGHSVYLYNITQGEKAGDPQQRISELRSTQDISARKPFTSIGFLTPNYLLPAI